MIFMSPGRMVTRQKATYTTGRPKRASFVHSRVPDNGNEEKVAGDGFCSFSLDSKASLGPGDAPSYLSVDFER